MTKVVTVNSSCVPIGHMPSARMSMTMGVHTASSR